MSKPDEDLHRSLYLLTEFRSKIQKEISDREAGNNFSAKEDAKKVFAQATNTVLCMDQLIASWREYLDKYEIR